MSTTSAGLGLLLLAGVGGVAVWFDTKRRGAARDREVVARAQILQTHPIVPEGAPPAPVHTASSRDHGGAPVSARSQNGWPASKNPADIDVVSVSVPGLRHGKTTIQVVRKVAPAFVEMIQWWEKNIEPVTQVGSYDYRTVRGSTTVISNHASGTAVDINQDKHPLGAVAGADGIPVAMREAIRVKAASLGLRWGGFFRGRKDAMHFECA